jgi:hypothetical protein
VVIILAFLIILILAGAGAAFHILWVLAALLIVLWLIGFAAGRGETSGAARRGWYSW